MAWKRGTQNNTAGEIRRGHIREFMAPSSKEVGIVGKLKIVSMEQTEFFEDYSESYFALVCTPNTGLPPQFHSHIENNILYLHSHQHPRCVLTALLNENVPTGCIVLNEIQLVNSKVCTGEIEDWTVYQGDTFVYDGREGVIGNTELRSVNRPTPVLKSISMWIRPRFLESIQNKNDFTINGKIFSQHLQKIFYGAILSLDELFLCTPPPSCLSIFPENAQHKEQEAEDGEDVDSIPIVCRIGEMEAVEEDVDDEEDILIPDCHRGIVDADTVIYLILEGLDSPLKLIQNPIKAESSVFELPNVVEIMTSDDEVFPVKRRLLRPCISLTAIVQAGKGKYVLPTDDNSKRAPTQTLGDTSPNSARVPVDACTFDRVLLYLEHEARNEPFKFDPLIANELLVASQSLQISGLQQLCEKILGSFQERVRKVPIRFQEVIDRNEQGRLASLVPSRNGKRGDTLLILNGMVLDITRWLDEHPGGSTIIPEQALNIDCTIFFEIYHASRQSFLYLKEFYIGEIAEEDIPMIPKGSRTNQNTPSAAFLEQLNKVTSWRLKSEELTKYATYKSF